MATFMIDAVDFSQFIRSYHHDCFDQASMGFGDVTQMDIDMFSHCCRNVWGLDSSTYRCNNNLYVFEVENAAKFNETGIARYGRVEQ